MQTLMDQTALWTPNIGAAIAVFLVFFILAKILKRIITNSAERMQLDRNITSLLARTSNVMVIIVGIVTALGTIGVNVSALVAGLGLIGFAIGFALKDTISNLLSGILILLGNYPPIVGSGIANFRYGRVL